MSVREQPASRADVLIAVNDADTRFLLRRLLEGRAYTYAKAADGLLALLLARTAPPRSLLLDLGLSGLDGLAVALRLQSSETLPGNVPVPRLTWHDHAGARTGRAPAG
jgi:CheY-like chemotaxis protein